MRAVDRKDLKGLAVHVAYPAGNVCGCSVPGVYHRISIGSKSSLARGKLVELAEREPGLKALLALLRHRRQDVTDNGHGQHRSHDAIEQDAHVHQKLTSGKTVWNAHRGSPTGWSDRA